MNSQSNDPITVADPLDAPPEGFLWELLPAHATALGGIRDQLPPEILGQVQFDVQTSVADYVRPPLRFKAQGSLKLEALGDFTQCPGGATEGYLISERLKIMLQSFDQEDVEFFPVEVELFKGGDCEEEEDELPPGGGPIVPGFWWMNHWRRFDVVDVRKSECVWGVNSGEFSDLDAAMAAVSEPARKQGFEPNLKRFRRLVFREPIAPEESLFGVRRLGWKRRFVSARLRAAIIRAGLVVRIKAVPLSPQAEHLLQATYAPPSGRLIDMLSYRNAGHEAL